jgi:hypothetical protein
MSFLSSGATVIADNSPSRYIKEGEDHYFEEEAAEIAVEPVNIQLEKPDQQPE